jgi:hypothetical protein
MSFPMLAGSCNGLWIVKTESKSLGASLGLAINLGMSVTSIRSSIVASHRMTKMSTCT